MSVYLVVNDSVTNADSLSAYFSVVGETLEGRDIDVLVSTSAAETVEGEPAGPRVVVMRFPDRDAFHEWYHSDEYQAIVGIRRNATDGFAVLADGRDNR
jgi:uncharacterized protein (DUF1330 family)